MARYHYFLEPPNNGTLLSTGSCIKPLILKGSNFQAIECLIFFYNQPYKRGRSPKSALMDRIAQQLPWCSDHDKLEELRRPDIFDYKTVDWLDVTAHRKELNRIWQMGSHLHTTSKGRRRKNFEDSALISKSGLLITEYEIAAYGK